jgi:hypothetical protein
VANSRVRGTVAYLEEGHADLSPVRGRGLSAAEIAEVLELVAWGERASFEVKETLERLYAEQAAEEVEAGLAIPLVVVKPPVSRLASPLVRLAMVLAVIAAVVAGVVVWRASSRRTSDRRDAAGVSAAREPGPRTRTRSKGRATPPRRPPAPAAPDPR